jgi:hypothetical protein
VPVFVPAGAQGPTRLDVVGVSSGTTAAVRLQVAADRTAAGDGSRPLSWPALLALLCLVGVGGAVVTALGRSRGGSRGSA